MCFLKAFNRKGREGFAKGAKDQGMNSSLQPVISPMVCLSLLLDNELSYPRKVPISARA